MARLPKRIRIVVGGVQLDAELKDTKTAEQLYAMLPYSAPVYTWGEEFYCHLPGVIDYRETATTKVRVGDVAYWGVGHVLTIFFGRTPMSIGDDPVPADRVNVIGRILGDATALRRALGASTISLDRIEEPKDELCASPKSV
ncbi:MAG: cyclophilin-like fold protein [Nitrospira sp.]|nr:cyclophilin-like fold protein [Nitrospira sp.]